MKIAIVGSGISGLVAAHELRHLHEVTVFEADDRIGGHTHTVDVEMDGERHAVDTGFIVYNERTYPNFVRLLEELGVESQPSDMSFGLSCERTGLEWGSRGLAGVFAQPRNLFRSSFRGMLRDIFRFNRESREFLALGDEKVALGDLLTGAGYGTEFIDHYVVPMGAAIWSAEPGRFLRMPAASFIRFFENHGLLESKPSLAWRVIRGGSARYVEKLVEPFRERIRLGCQVREVRRGSDHIEIRTADAVEAFDHVVFAVHSDQALAILGDASPLERHLLGSISYQRNEVVLHTDASLMPKSPRAAASWNYRIPRDPGGRVLVTYDMNRLQGIESQQRFLVTLNPEGRIDPHRVLQSFVYDHPVFDADAIEVQKRHAEISGGERTSYCGAWWGSGFHEDGVRSALSVCERLAADV